MLDHLDLICILQVKIKTSFLKYKTKTILFVDLPAIVYILLESFRLQPKGCTDKLFHRIVNKGIFIEVVNCHELKVLRKVESYFLFLILAKTVFHNHHSFAESLQK